MIWKLCPCTDFSLHKDIWDNINSSSSNTALLHTDFVDTILAHFGHNNIVLAILYSDDQPVAISLLEKQRPGTWSTFQPSQAPIGMWNSIKSLSLDHALSALAKKLHGLPLIVSVTQQDPDLFSQPSSTGHIRTIDYIRTARVVATGTFDEYWSKRGKNLRHNMKRQRNRLERENVITRLETITDSKDIAKAIRDYGVLESAGWKSTRGSAIHSENTQGHFYTDLLSRFCLRNRGCVYKYWYNDELVAMDLCIQHNSVFIILKTTYDETQKKSSPALLMRQEYFQEIFLNDSINTIEFYGRVMSWHEKWSDEFRTMYHINYYRWPILSHLHKLTSI